MPLYDLLSANRVAIVANPQNRNAVIDIAAGMLADGSPVPSRAIGDSLREREGLASTGIGHGVAIPHGRTAGLDYGRGAFLRLAEPVDFGAPDGRPVDLVLAMSVPDHYVQQHLQLLAELAECFADDEFRQLLRTARDTDELSYRLLGHCRRRRSAA